MRDIFLGFSNTLSSYHNNLIQYVALLLWNAKKAELSARSRRFGIEIQAVVMNRAQLRFLCPRWVLQQQAPPGLGDSALCKNSHFPLRKKKLFFANLDRRSKFRHQLTLLCMFWMHVSFRCEESPPFACASLQRRRWETCSRAGAKKLTRSEICVPLIIPCGMFPLN